MLDRLHRILPWIVSRITGHDRYLPEMEWSRDLWVHNIFRIYEFLFWRREGIRCESITGIDPEGNYFRKTFTFEARCAYFETDVRAFLKKISSARLVRVPVYVDIPVFAGVGEWKRMPIGYSFAIAFDAYSINATQSSSPHTCSHTASGSNRWVNTHHFMGTNAQTTTGATYGGVSMTLGVQDGSSPGTGYYGTSILCLASPGTGAQNSVVSWSGGGNAFQYVASYTGVVNTGIGGTDSREDAGSTFNSTLTAVGGGWVTWSGAGDGSFPTGVTTGAMRSTTGSQWCLADSNGVVSAGSYAYGYTNSSGTSGGITGLEFGIAAASGPANVKKYMSVAKASIKKVSPTAIASVKKLNSVA